MSLLVLSCEMLSIARVVLLGLAFSLAACGGGGGGGDPPATSSSPPLTVLPASVTATAAAGESATFAVTITFGAQVDVSRIDLVLFSTDAATYAIDIDSHRSVWSVPHSGDLALSSNGVLYIVAPRRIDAFKLL